MNAAFVPAPSLFGRWFVAALLLSFCVIGSLAWLHYTQRHALQQATAYLGELRQAQIELSKGFLQLSLADSPQSPFSRDAGLALLQQAVNTIQRAQDKLGTKNSSAAQDFRRSATEFWQQLERWRQSPTADAGNRVKLRIAYLSLERQADQVDAVGQRHIDTLVLENGQVFAFSLSGAVLALGLIIGIVLRSVQNQRHALLEQNVLYQAKLNSETRFRRLFQEAPVAMALVDKRGKIQTQNSRFTQLFGYTPEDIPTLTAWWSQAYPEPDYRSKIRASWHAAISRAVEFDGDIKLDEQRIRCKDGSERIVQIHSIVQTDGLLTSYLDITEQRLYEDRLRLWMESFQQAQVGMVISDAQTNCIIMVNPAFAQQRGYRCEDMAGMPIAELFPRDRLGDMLGIINDLIVTSHSCFESEHLRQDGSRFPVLLDITVLYDKAGRPLNRFAFVLDLTARKQVEQALINTQQHALQQQNRARLAVLNQMQDAGIARLQAETALAALRESESRLKLFIDYAPASLAMFDRDMRYIAFSKRWLDDYGLKERELFGRRHYDVFPEIGEDWKAVHQRAMAGEVIRAEEDRFERADGSVQWLRWEVRPWYIPEKGVGGIVVFTEDITARILAKCALRSSETRMRTLISTIPDLIWLKDVDGMYLLCNPALERLFGAPEAEIIGHSDYEFVDAELADQYRAHDRCALEADAPTINEEWLTFAQDHYHGLFQTIKTRVVDADGQVVGILGIARDITAMRQAEQNLRASNAELEIRVAERTAELEALNQSLESFVYSVSHDLKAPLRGIEGYSQLLSEDYGAVLDEDGRLFVANIREGVARMGELIEDLLAYSRMERRTLASSQVDLAHMISRLLAERADDIAADNIIINTDVTPVIVEIDVDGLSLVMRNLIDNAIKFSKQAVQPHIEIRAWQENDHINISVEDNGIGFDMMYHDRIFEIFQRLQRFEDYPGTGVGLALVKKAMQRMGGKVWAKSTPGQGACFYLQLPVIPSESKNAETTSDAGK